MTEPTVRGNFVWHELMTGDVPAAVAYYKKVVGWKTQAFDANYQMWVAKRGPMGGVVALPAGQATPYWLPYVGTTDIEATVQLAQKLGGKVITPVTDIPNAGRYSVLADPQGAAFGVHWSPKAMPTSKPQLGDFAWQELATTDYQAAFAFYQALFGWEKAGEHDMGEMGIYFMFGLNGHPLGGMFNKPPTMPAAWCCYAEVADARKVAKVAAKAGGKVLNGPMQVPGGSWIVQLADPQGGMHAVVSSAPMAATASPASKAAASTTVTVKKASKKKSNKKKAIKKKATKKKVTATKPVKKVAKKKSAKKASKKLSKKVSKKVTKKPATKKKSAKKKVILKKSPTKKTKVAKKKAAKRKK